MKIKIHKETRKDHDGTVRERVVLVGKISCDHCDNAFYEYEPAADKHDHHAHGRIEKRLKAWSCPVHTEDLE